MSPLASPKTIASRPVGSVGYGMMNLTLFGNVSHEDAIKPMKAAIDNGASFWNAGTFYGPPDANSLQLLKYYFTKYPEDAPKVVLSLKGAYDGATHTPDGSREGVRASVEQALRILDGTHAIDLFECARVDPKVPIEETVRALAELITEGKIGSYGLSEVSAETIRRAHAVHPPAAVEVELSLFSRHALEKGGTADTCRELNIPLVGYSPLDRGWLTGQLKTLGDLPKDDIRHHYPRFQPGNFEKNVSILGRSRLFSIPMLFSIQAYHDSH
ncbi:NADP-dependent oxidoreductase domain-containing protein [Xylariaceae sp. FL1019]|nr:NADP-dependent oxidoreductase domain-containing protein [Xylariaceae sp. FL1019]